MSRQHQIQQSLPNQRGNVVKQSIVLAGVGGQGILSIARGLSLAAFARGLNIRQAEVHGMSQRGGAVQAHVRISDSPLYSDVIPQGTAEVVLAVEPLEALRYVQFLKTDGMLVASTNPFVNIPDYPPIEEVIARISVIPGHVLLDMERLAKAAGSPRAANMIALGATTPFLELDLHDVESAVQEIFAAKGDKIVQINLRALRMGRQAALAYRGGLERGLPAGDVRQWLDDLEPEQLLEEQVPSPDSKRLAALGSSDLSLAESQGVEQMLIAAYVEGRYQLYEHEVYRLIDLLGAIEPPRHLFMEKGETPSAEALHAFTGDKVVLKLVARDVVHKSDVNAVRFVPRELEAIQSEIGQLTHAFEDKAAVAGVLMVEFVDAARRSFGSELFIGIRATREFGPVIAAGLGGVDTEYLASRMRPGAAIAKAAVLESTAESFFAQFQQTAAYDVIAGKARGHERLVADHELLRCFRVFLSLAKRFCVERGSEGPDFAELEINPFAFRQQQLVPLDGRARLATAPAALPPRPLDPVRRMLEPHRIAVLGASAKSHNFGRIILNNIQACGFSNDHLFVVKPDTDAIDGVKCVADFAALPEPVDLLVVAAPAASLPEIISAANSSGRVRAGVLIPGGVGETEGSEALDEAVQAAIADGRRQVDGGAVWLGPNCMGIQSRPGRFDTFFIPPDKLDPRRDRPARGVALISQSGAFIVSRLSRMDTLDPTVTISIGNQADLTVGDFLTVTGERNDVHTIGVYVEGFANHDGLHFLEAVRRATAAGKRVIFYKAGRTAVGREAAAGHTTAVAGDYDVCLAAAEQAGALCVETFEEFEELMTLCCGLPGRRIAGKRVFGLTNAGMEAVSMADAVQAGPDRLTLPQPSEDLRDRIRSVLSEYGLGGLANVRNPLDLTAMASEKAYQELAQVLLASDEIDAVILGCVPLVPQMNTTRDRLAAEGSFVQFVPRLMEHSDKPIVMVIDSGKLYDDLAERLMSAGVPVLRNAAAAVRGLDRLL
jgi:indolepyruvate ferredoxin oxidoreductase beta subunit